MKDARKPRYGNWISDQLIRKVLASCILFAMLAAVAHSAASGAIRTVLTVLFGLLSVLSLVSFVYFLIARRWFSYEGGRIQEKILDLLLSNVHWDGIGRALDIGCGSGALTNLVAKKYPDARVTGVDYWGGSWGYHQSQCKMNATIEGVADRTEFAEASASKLPFEDVSFDLVVSNLTFHEVRDSRNKRDLLREALRTLRPGGSFAFQDLFMLKAFYGRPDELVAAVEAMGVREVHFEDTSKAEFIPWLLKLPFMVGTMAVLYGKK